MFHFLLYFLFKAFLIQAQRLSLYEQCTSVLATAMDDQYVVFAVIANNGDMSAILVESPPSSIIDDYAYIANVTGGKNYAISKVGDKVAILMQYMDSTIQYTFLNKTLSISKSLKTYVPETSTNKKADFFSGLIEIDSNNVYLPFLNNESNDSPSMIKISTNKSIFSYLLNITTGWFLHGVKLNNGNYIISYTNSTTKIPYFTIMNQNLTNIVSDIALYPESTWMHPRLLSYLMNSSGNVLFLSHMTDGIVNSSCYYSIFSSSGTRLINATRINNDISFGSRECVVQKSNCLPNGNCVIVFSILNVNYLTYFSLIDPSGTVVKVNSVNFEFIGMISSDCKDYNLLCIDVVTFNDSSFVITWAEVSEYTYPIYAQYYYSNGTRIVQINNCLIPNSTDSTCEVCTSGLNLTNGKLACASPIDNCIIYNDDMTCQQCKINMTVNLTATGCIPQIDNCLQYSYDMLTCIQCNTSYFSIKGVVCAAVIANCVTYNDTKCITCVKNFTLSMDQTTCFMKLVNCTGYNTSNYSQCTTCKNGNILTISKTACVAPIMNCSEYSDNGNCSKCDLNFILNQGKNTCIHEIQNCSSYNDDNTCKSCNAPYLLSTSNLSCYLEIPDCNGYSSDYTKCQSCNNSKIPTVGQLKCAIPIVNCTSYADNASCISCENFTYLTINKTNCSNEIKNCVNYSDDKLCQSCDNLTQLTLGKTACASIIQGCLTYTEDKLCKDCNISTSISSKKTACATIIQNCTAYDENMSCISCENFTYLTVNKTNCANEINNCLNYSDDKLCQSCNNSTSLTIGKSACASNIQNCLSYTDDKLCQVCNSSTVLSDKKTACVPAIINCTAYADNTSCISCAIFTFLTINKANCSNEIKNCVTYSDDKLCKSCESSTQLTSGKTACASNIQGCLSYSDDKLCKLCNSSTVLSSGKTTCVKPIVNCSNYTIDGLCQNCMSSYVLTISKVGCVSPIIDCFTYFDNGTCQNCNNAKALTTNKVACANPINSCIEYDDITEKCLTCEIGKIFSTSHSTCINFIGNCLNYSDDGTCNSCLFGTGPSSNKLSCVILTNLTQNQSNQTIQSKLSTNSTTQVGDTCLVSKTNATPITVTNNFDSTRSIDLAQPTVTLVSSKTSTKVPAKTTKKGAVLSIFAQLDTVSTDTYTISVDLAVKKSKRILADNTSSSSDNLPDYFVISYEPPEKFFIGSDEEIQKQMVVLQNNLNSNKKSHNFMESSGENDFDTKFLAIFLSVFGFLFIIGGIVCIISKRKRSLNKKLRSRSEEYNFCKTGNSIEKNEMNVLMTTKE